MSHLFLISECQLLDYLLWNIFKEKCVNAILFFIHELNLYNLDKQLSLYVAHVIVRVLILCVLPSTKMLLY